ncbi:cobalamin biosynthesis protein [Brunnivagina elsteri]|uniref:Cobalamin biosynthesis protein CbiG n=1 Tax=Brunnivagina elsteri CCALA 953 TaxID=987040 RepID=A0A2A2TME1_9CYAN|nr:cobalamin biosynthesis protein [Calothrix elsteri]PAX59496.1 cobalamin biosynthesis protein CbiG [Calothrix elsteri CCALA 953]
MYVLWVGIGCKRETSRELIELAIKEIFRKHDLSESAIAGIATINSKAAEVGLLELCQIRNLPLKTFPAEVLQNISVPNPSQLVEKKVGTASVAEAAAISASLDFSHVNFADLKVGGINNLLIPKQIFRSSNPNLQGIVTIAVVMIGK